MDISNLLKHVNLDGIWRKPQGNWWKHLPPGSLNIYCAIATPKQMKAIEVEVLSKAFQASSVVTTYNKQKVDTALAAEALTPQEFYREIYMKDGNVRRKMGQWQLTAIVS